MNSSDVVIFFSSGRSGNSAVKKLSPAFFSRQDGKIIEVPTRYLRARYVESGRSSSPNTWRAAAYTLASWWDYLSSRGINWDQAIRSDIIEFRSHFESLKSPVTGDEYSRNTVAAKLIVVLDFYLFQYSKGEYSGSICSEFDDKTYRGKYNKYQKKSIKNIIPGRRPSIKIRPYSQEDWRRFISCIDINNGLNAERDKLIFTVIVCVGLRVSELVGLNINQFLPLVCDHPHVNQFIEVLGKGEKARLVAIPNWLIINICKYIFNIRQLIVEKEKIKNHNRVFVTGFDSNSPGSPISVRRVQEIHLKNCLAAGLLRNSRENSATNSLSAPDRPKYRVHDLRHTYAIWTYHLRISLGDSEPWKFIQVQLGHSSLDTTINTYLKYVSILDDRASSMDLRTAMGW